MSPSNLAGRKENPKIYFDLVHSFNLPKTASIIEIGIGDRKFVDYLLEEGYENITLLDISALAIIKVKRRLGSKAAKVSAL
jgi:hypothetical protein